VLRGRDVQDFKELKRQGLSIRAIREAAGPQRFQDDLRIEAPLAQLGTRQSPPRTLSAFPPPDA
jgi:hypothetical protein